MTQEYTELIQIYLKHSDEKQSAIRTLAKILPTENMGNLLDIGCGTGVITKSLVNYFENIVAIDKTNRMKSGTEKNPKVKFIQTDFLNFTTDIKFDCVLAAYLLWEIPFQKWDSILQKIGKLLKKNGFLIVIDAYPKTKFDNPFFNFNTEIEKHNEYPDWHEYLKSRNLKYKSHPFASQIKAESKEEMYKILQFFFREEASKEFYKNNKEKVVKNLKTKIDMRHVIDFVYFN